MYSFFHSAADPAMDGNKMETPPVIRVPSKEDEKKLANLKKKLATVEKELKEKFAKFKYRDPANIKPKPAPEETHSMWFEDSLPKGKLQATGAPLKFTKKGTGPCL